MTRARNALFTAHLVGNALLLLIGYYWLGLGEPDAAHLALSAFVILLFAVGVLCLHGASLVVFRHNTFLSALSRALQSIVPLFLLGIFVLLIYTALQHFYISFGHEAFTLGSYSTMKLRRPVEPTRVLQAFHMLIWLMRWFVVPAFAMPLAAEVANKGWSGFRFSAFQKSKNPVFWILTGLLFLVAIALPLHLFFWIPKMSSFFLEAVSATMRIAAGYLLFTAGLLAVEYFTVSGKPRVTQPSTAASP